MRKLSFLILIIFSSCAGNEEFPDELFVEPSELETLEEINHSNLEIQLVNHYPKHYMSNGDFTYKVIEGNDSICFYLIEIANSSSSILYCNHKDSIIDYHINNVSKNSL